MEPKGLKSSCRSVSRVSSERLVTRIVALSSAVGWKHDIYMWKCSCSLKVTWIMTRCSAAKNEKIKPTSAVRLHGFPSSRASIPQAGGHILPSLALSRLCRLGFSFFLKKKKEYKKKNHYFKKNSQQILNVEDKNPECDYCIEALKV